MKTGCLIVAAVPVTFIGIALLVAPFVPPPKAPPAKARSDVSTEIPTDRAGVFGYIDGLIVKGDEDSTTRAIALINERFSASELKDDDDVRALLGRAIKAATVAGAGGREQEYMDRVTTYWLPQIAKIDTGIPTTPEVLWSKQRAFEELARSVADGEEFKMGAGAEARKKLHQALSAKQREIFPILRRGYGEMMRAQMWTFDVDVRVTGSGNRNVNFVGGRFAANRNIADTQASVQDHLGKLRFGTAHYEWFQGAGGYSYKITAPSDGAVGTWDNGTFDVANQ